MSSTQLKMTVPEHVEAVVKNALKSSYLREGCKGCIPAIFSWPVELEPEFEPFQLKDFPESSECSTQELLPKSQKNPLLSTLRLWLSPDDEYKWEIYEDLCKQFSFLSTPMAFEISGNASRISIQFTLAKKDLPPMQVALKTLFPRMELETVDAKNSIKPMSASCAVALQDYFCEPPYWRALTQEFDGFPLEFVYSALSTLRRNTTGVYQVLLQPVNSKHDWKRNIENLVDTEYKANYEGYFNPSTLYSQHPSYYLPKISEREENKAHPDKPFFAVALRIGVFGQASQVKSALRRLHQFNFHFLYGGRPLHSLTQQDYRDAKLSEEDMKNIFLKRVSYRRGMLLNSGELARLCHYPPLELDTSISVHVDGIKGFPVPDNLTREGLLLGRNKHLGKRKAVMLPDNLRDRHLYIIGKTGTGKSTMIQRMILEDIKAGNGCGLIDPHGELAESLLDYIPIRRARDVIYFDVTDAAFIPCFNPFHISPEDDAGKIADDFCACFADSLMSGNFGPRMLHIFRIAVYSLLKTPGAVFTDISKLLSRTDQGQLFRERVLEHIDNPEAIKFWLESFPSFRESTLFPVVNKLSKILLNDRIHRILSQRDNRIDLRCVADEGKIIIFNISTGFLGSGNANILGSFIISLFHKVALNRADTPPEKRRSFYLYLDEFHRFKTGSIESMLAEARKYKIALILAHQDTGQLSKEAQKALGNVSTMISFALDAEDASKIAREFKKEIEPKQIINLSVGRAYAKIGNAIVDLETPPPKAKPKRSNRGEIIKLSQASYCVSLNDFIKQDPSLIEPSVRSFDTF